MKTFRIFLSAPGDVDADRKQVREVLLGLARGPFVRGRVHVDVVSWDDPYGPTMDARVTPQEAVDRGLPTPAHCDLTVVLLWGRMGTPLTHRKADGTPYLSGTEWEFENALAANKPVFVYRRTGSVPLEPADPDFEERVTQIRRVNAFFGRFKGEGGGALLRGYATYNSTDELLKRLRADVESHLNALLREETETQAGARPGATTVFICYRREDSADAAGRLHDRLVEAYGRDRVFMDIDSIPAGIDFVEHVSEQIARCSAVLVVIGRQWLKAKGKDRRRRLDNENDFVRAEVAAALQQKIRVIPVLVQDAKMPTATDLPESISALARRNARELNANRWRTDVERLIEELDQVMKG